MTKVGVVEVKNPSFHRLSSCTLRATASSAHQSSGRFTPGATFPVPKQRKHANSSATITSGNLRRQRSVCVLANTRKTRKRNSSYLLAKICCWFRCVVSLFFHFPDFPATGSFFFFFFWVQFESEGRMLRLPSSTLF